MPGPLVRRNNNGGVVQQAARLLRTLPYDAAVRSAVRQLGRSASEYVQKTFKGKQTQAKKSGSTGGGGRVGNYRSAGPSSKGPGKRKYTRKTVASKKRKRVQYNIAGSTKYLENGGILTDSQCLYVAHSTMPAHEVTQAACRAVVKELFRQMGDSILNWNQIPRNQGSSLVRTMRFEYIFPELALAPNVVTYTIANTDSYTQIASELENRMDSNIATDAIEFLSVSIYETYSANVQTQRAIVYLKNTLLDFEITSKLTLQNVTLATTSAETNNDEVSNVESQPLKGKVYNGFAHRNYMELQSELSTGLRQVLIADPENGLVSINATSDNYGLLKKPPQKKVLGMKDEAYISMGPGELKNFFTKYKRRLTWNKFCTICVGQFNSDIQIKQAFGSIQCIALEKYLDNRSASSAPIRLQYEVNHVIKCAYVSARTLPSAPIQEVN
ncbi:MAG: putative capsid protein [Arizlama virus AZLM_719]|nr:MAG: putative capsid protein [Arizlama virus]